MTVGKPYEVTRKIKLHTNPLRETEVIKTGIFKKETRKSYIFNEFKVQKATVIKIEKVTKYDADTIAEFVKRLEKHYPYSPTVMKTIYEVANEMIKEQEKK